MSCPSMSVAHRGSQGAQALVAIRGGAIASQRPKMRALGVDHGERRIGIAISDATGTIARPLDNYRATCPGSAMQIACWIRLPGMVLTVIVIGQSMNEAGLPNLAGLRAMRFAELLKRYDGRFRSCSGTSR